MFSLVIPVYKNEESIPELVGAIEAMDRELQEDLEAVFVVDGSPDRCFELLRDTLPNVGFRSRLLLLSRNFGSFAAVRAGLTAARGPYYAVMAADLQEPPKLIADFFHSLAHEPLDVVIGTREGRDDPWLSRLAAGAFWYLYRLFVVPDMPVGGVDVFGCNQSFRDQLLRLEESHSSLIALIFWLGFRRKYIAYRRRPRCHGKSAWTFRKKLHYFMDSVFAFTDLPIKLLIGTGILGMAFSLMFGLLVFIARMTGEVSISGYAATVLSVIFFGALNTLGIGLIGSYAWRTYENTKRRQLYVVLSEIEFEGQRI